MNFSLFFLKKKKGGKIQHGGLHPKKKGTEFPTPNKNKNFFTKDTLLLKHGKKKRKKKYLILKPFVFPKPPHPLPIKSFLPTRPRHQKFAEREREREREGLPFSFLFHDIFFLNLSLSLLWAKHRLKARMKIKKKKNLAIFSFDFGDWIIIIITFFLGLNYHDNLSKFVNERTKKKFK